MNINAKSLEFFACACYCEYGSVFHTFQEAMMTDWDSMVEEIQGAMQAVDRAHAATETLREKTDREGLEKFQTEMKELHKRLEQMQAILAHEDTYTIDELADALGSAMGSGQTYHRIAHYEVKHS
jgi:uncharacterized protein YukE